MGQIDSIGVSYFKSSPYHRREGRLISPLPWRERVRERGNLADCKS
jgi:hypothetical protein